MNTMTLISIETIITILVSLIIISTLNMMVTLAIIRRAKASLMSSCKHKLTIYTVMMRQ